MRKFFVLVVALVLFASLGFCGIVKLNVWIRGIDCNIVEKWGAVHVYNCHGEEILYQRYTNGHTEVTLPPGAYIVQARVCNVPGNYNTDRAFVLAKCGEEACVNLILPRFVRTDYPRIKPQVLPLQYCPVAILPALVWNAGKAGVNAKEIQQVIDVLARAAGIDKKMMMDSLRAEIQFFEENLKMGSPEEQKEAMDFIQQAKRIVSKD